MAITPGDDVTVATEPLPRGPLVESGGQLSRSFFNWFQGKDRKLGEIISGVNLNRQNIVQLQTDYQAADGAISSAYIAADAVVAANAESANAALSTTLTAAYQAADSVISASVTNIAEAYATNSAATARLVWTVDVGTNAATIEQTAATGYDDGTWNGSAITLTANEITLDADAINFGAQTEFDTGSETFITEVGGIRSRYGTAFGNVSSQVVMWHGPTSVAQGSESRTNGYLAIGTDGQIYHNAAALSWGATAAEAAASNALVPVGANACVDSEFQRGLYAWQNGFAGNSAIAGTHAVTLNTFGAAARAYYGARLTGTPASGTVFDVIATKASYLSTDLANSKLFALPVAPGDRVYASARFTGAGISAASSRVFWLDKDGVVLSGSDAGSALPAGQALATIAAWDRIGGFVTAPANAAFAMVFFRATCDGTADPYCLVTSPMLARVPANQTEPPPYVPGRSDPIGDQTGSNTAAAITGQGVWATGNYYEQTSDPGSVPNGSFWFKTDTNELYVRRSGSWGKVATIANQNITISRTNGFVKTRIGAGTITSDSVSFSSTGGSGTGYTYAHELFTSFSTGPTATISSASGSPITASAAGAVPGDEIRGFVQTTVTDSAGNKATLLSPVALFCES